MEPQVQLRRCIAGGVREEDVVALLVEVVQLLLSLSLSLIGHHSRRGVLREVLVKLMLDHERLLLD